MKRLQLLTVLIIIGFMHPLFAQGAMDHIKPYGNLFLFLGGNYEKAYDSGDSGEVDADLIDKINDNSNLGFNFTYQKYSGVFELGIDDIENDREVKIRKAYGIYKTPVGELMIGLGWSPYTKWSHESADYYRSEGFGAIYEDPTLQLKLTFGGFYFDIIKPYVPTQKLAVEEEVNIPTTGTSTETEYTMVEREREITTGQTLDNIKAFLPKLALGYEHNGRSFDYGIGLAGNVYYLDSTDGGVEFNKKWIYSYMAYLNCGYRTGDFSLYLSGGFLVNPANYGIAVQSQGNDTYFGGAAMAIENIATGEWEIKDTWNVQSYIEFEYRFSSSLVWHLGYGFSMVDYPMEETEIDYAMEYYTNLKINLAGLIALTPSVSFRDYMKDMSGGHEGYEICGGILATVSYY